MKRISSLKSIATAAVVLGAFGAASAAHASTDVFFSVQAPGVYMQSAPAYAYVQPNPVFVQPQYGQVWHRGYQPEVVSVYERDGWRHHRHYQRDYQRDYQRTGPYGDYDRDGVPNRWDHAPANPYRR
jgi:hypothetical protein